jgi:hypothetical protein
VGIVLARTQDWVHWTDRSLQVPFWLSWSRSGRQISPFRALFCEIGREVSL